MSKQRTVFGDCLFAILAGRRRSVISEFDLVCDMDWAPQLVNSCYFVGFLFGAGLWGMVSDRMGAQSTPPRVSRRKPGAPFISAPGRFFYTSRACVCVSEALPTCLRRQLCADTWMVLSAGRRKALFAAVATSLVFGVASALSPDYWWYAVLRALTGGCHGVFQPAYCMPAHRCTAPENCMTFLSLRRIPLASIAHLFAKPLPAPMVIAVECAAGFGNSGMGIICFVLAVEPVGPSWRGTCGIVQVPLIAYCTWDTRSCPCAATCLISKRGRQRQSKAHTLQAC